MRFRRPSRKVARGGGLMGPSPGSSGVAGEWGGCRKAGSGSGRRFKVWLFWLVRLVIGEEYLKGIWDRLEV